MSSEVDMPDWPRVPIQDVSIGVYDGPHATPKPADEGPIFLGIKNITEDGRLDLTDIRHISEEEYPKWTKRVTPRAGDIVFTYEATLNRYAVIPAGFHGCLGRRTALVRPDPDKVDHRYLFYYFFSREWRDTIAKNTLHGSTVDRIPLTDFPTFEVRLPELSIQRRIADILGALDDLITVNTRRIAILEKLAEAIYHGWFVNLDFPGSDQRETEARTIPEGWGTAPIRDLAEVHKGRSYRSRDLVDDGGLPFLNLKCVARGGGFRRDCLKRYSGNYKPTQVARSGDIIMAVTDMTQERRIIARPARVPDLGEEEFVYSMDLVKIEPNQEVSPLYLYGTLKYSSFADLVKQYANGANVLHLRPSHVEDYEILLPPESIQEAFARAVDRLYQLKDNLHNRNEALARARDLLIPRLVTGEIDVSALEPDSEAIVA